MFKALGYSHTEFSVTKVGRLCRGCERWIEPFELQEEPPAMQRLVVSGAVFSDDSARDALRGVQHSEVELAQIIATLFPRKNFLAFMEDGHPADIPDGAESIEAYSGYRAGGRVEAAMVRWQLPVSGIREIRKALGKDPNTERVRGFAVLSGEEDLQALSAALFLLTGMSSMDSPPSLYQPAALPEVLEHVRAVILIHRDKHGPVLGVYSREIVKTEGRLEPLCEKAKALLIRFSIPPMLARWDRALYEFRQEWDAEANGAFPVPQVADPSNWEPRRRGRRRSKKGAESTSENEDALKVTTDETSAPNEVEVEVEVSPEIPSA